MAEAVFEMLWDCRYCGARKLLGLSHRHCPSCGAAQDANARYFPAESEKVAVQDHEYVGADVVCRYCQAASSRRAHHCGRCGAPLAEGSAASTKTDGGVVQPLITAEPPQPPAGPVWKVLIPVLALVVISAAAVLLLWKKDGAFVVTGRDWQRSVEVQGFGPVQRSAWCSDLPAGARDVTRHQERRGQREVPDGEDCHVQKHDRGDGTFKEEQVCTPRSKNEPVYEDKCTFTLLTWSHQREERAQGDANQPPRWPEVNLPRKSCSEPGCEREGSRSEKYGVSFKDDAGHAYRCEYSENVWRGFTPGRRYPGKLRALVGSLDCGSLGPL